VHGPPRSAHKSENPVLDNQTAPTSASRFSLLPRSDTATFFKQCTKINVDLKRISSHPDTNGAHNALIKKGDNMKRPNLLSTSMLWSAALVSLACTAVPAFAQDTQKDTQKDSDEEIVVTGSRIPRPDFSAPNPIQSVTAQDIEQSGEVNLLEYLQSIPALVGSFDSGQTAGSAGFIGSTGLNLLNLRNLGIERTLVLVDGRRHVASLPETAAVDIGSIPEDLIDRIDVVTGGAGAVYGADAVSGAVNFIMKKNFEGLTFRAQDNISQAGSPNDWRVTVTGGHNFAGGRGNISAAFEVYNEGRLRAFDRHYLRPGFYRTLRENINDPSDDPNIPDRVPVAGASFVDTARAGAIFVDFANFNPFQKSRHLQFTVVRQLSS
jgi:iron complex outermembrane receptor protein